jgi:hypothetical protein
MAEVGNGETWFGAWPGFLVAFVLTLGAVLVQAPLRPDRPPEVRAGLPALGAQDVDARLWQDPFGAVDAARKPAETQPAETERSNAATGRHDIPWLARQIGNRPACGNPNGEDTSPCVEVLAILVDGGPSVGAAERRRRDRYAALSGLMLQGFFPDDPEHIGYVELGVHTPPKYVPFE